MSDYKRFIAYVYEYPENIKGENRGFVRVEARNGSCQMEFRLNVISLPEGSPLNVCGFVRIRDLLFGIPIGILRAGKNGISGRLMAPAVHMGDTAFSLEDLSGLLILGPENRVYATAWDDIPLAPDRFTTDPRVLQDPAPQRRSRKSPRKNPLKLRLLRKQRKIRKGSSAWLPQRKGPAMKPLPKQLPAKTREPLDPRRPLGNTALPLSPHPAF